MRRLALVVTGDRHADPGDWEEPLHDALLWWRERFVHAVLLHGDGVGPGGAEGIDRMAGRIGARLAYAVVPLPAQWDELGLRAGPMRNAAMLSMAETLRRHGYTVEVLACHDRIDASKGTRHCAAMAALRYRFPVRQLGSDGRWREIGQREASAWV